MSASLPEGAILTARIEVVSYLEPGEPDMQYAVSYDGDLPLSSCLGLLELAKLDLIDRTDRP